MTDQANPTPGASSADHLDGLDGLALEAEPEIFPEGEGGGTLEPNDATISLEVFQKVFNQAFVAAGEVSGLDTLATAPARPNAPAASETLYEIILETPWLHFIIKPQSVWFERVFTLAMFAYPVGVGCMMELRAHKARPVTPEPANDPEPGPERAAHVDGAAL